jgi:hypothetical protein
MSIFTSDGKLMIPINKRKKRRKNQSDDSVRYVVNKAYCPKGCNIVDKHHPINGVPGIRIAFESSKGAGEFVVSAIEGDFEKKILSGILTPGEKYDLMCPHCRTKFKKLVNCNCSPDAEMVVVGLTSKLNYNNAITFCNVIGCPNGAFIKSGEAIMHMRLMAH